MKKTLCFLAAALMMVATALAADVSGKWTASVTGRGGQARDVTFNFKADGEKLTGTMSGFRGNDVEISDGRISGDDLSFKVKMEFNGNAMVMNYAGKISGAEIKFKRTVEGRENAQEFTAKKTE